MSTSPAEGDVSVGGEGTSEGEVQNVTPNVEGQGLSVEESADSHSLDEDGITVQTAEIEVSCVLASKEIDCSDQTERTPVKNNKIPSPPRPTRIVHGGIRTKAFFSNLPVQQNLTLSDVNASADKPAIVAAPIDNSRSTEKRSTSHLHSKDIDLVTKVNPGGSDKETLRDSPNCGSLEETESFETCSEDETEQLTEDNSRIVLEPKQVVDTGNEPRFDRKDCEGSRPETISADSNDGSKESKIMPEIEEAGKYATVGKLIETNSTEKADVSCSDKMLVSEEFDCAISIERHEQNVEIQYQTRPDDLQNLNVEDKAEVEIAPEVDEENEPPALLDDSQGFNFEDEARVEMAPEVDKENVPPPLLDDAQNLNLENTVRVEMAPEVNKENVPPLLLDNLQNLNLEGKAKIEMAPEVDKENVPPPLLDDSQNLNLEDKAEVEIVPEVDKENVPPPFPDDTPDVKEKSAVDGKFEENHCPSFEDSHPEFKTSGW